MNRLLAIDLFSGCGGVSEGLRQAGFDVAAAIEIDELAAETYARNHPDTMLWQRDIREVDAMEIRERVLSDGQDLAVLAACAPCQGFSRLRTLNRNMSVNDARNDLVLQILPFVAELRPWAVMLENVPGAQMSPQMVEVRERLSHEGYQFSDAVLDVADFGVAQRRRRYILIGARGTRPGFPAHVTSRRTVREAIGHLPNPGESGDPMHDVTANRSTRIEALIAQIPMDGGSRSALPFESQLACHKNSTGFSDVYGRMAWEKPSPTITSGFVSPSKGRFLHPSQNRTITPREAALLQGFPAEYYFSMRKGKYRVAELIGNAVPPEFARRQAVMIHAMMKT